MSDVIQKEDNENGKATGKGEKRRGGGREMQTTQGRKGQPWRGRKGHEKKGRGKDRTLSSIYAPAKFKKELEKKTT